MTTNMIEINGVKAVVSYDPDIELFRGEFVGLNGGADFYADTVRKLHTEGKKSLKVFLEMCDEKGIEPYKHFSGRFNVRIDPGLHERLSANAKAKGESINTVVSEALEQHIS